MELAAITEPLAGEEEAEVTLGERSGSDRRGGSLRIGGGGKDEGAKGVGRIGPAEEEEKGKKKKVFVLCVCVCRVVGWNRASLFSSCAFGTGYVVTTMCLDGLSPRPMDTQTHTHASIHTAGWRRRERRCTRPPSRASRRKRSGGKRRKKKRKSFVLFGVERGGCGGSGVRSRVPWTRAPTTSGRGLLKSRNLLPRVLRQRPFQASLLLYSSSLFWSEPQDPSHLTTSVVFFFTRGRDT